MNDNMSGATARADEFGDVHPLNGAHDRRAADDADEKHYDVAATPVERPSSPPRGPRIPVADGARIRVGPTRRHRHELELERNWSVERT
jgi:hypothetical protein